MSLHPDHWYAKETQPFYESLVEIGARALCRWNNMDPDFIPKGEINPNWHRDRAEAKVVIDAIFDRNKTI